VLRAEPLANWDADYTASESPVMTWGQVMLPRDSYGTL